MVANVSDTLIVLYPVGPLVEGFREEFLVDSSLCVKRH